MEEYFWISKLAHHPVFTRRAHPVLRRVAKQYGVKITIAGPDDAAVEPYVQAIRDATRRQAAGIMMIGWNNKEVVAAIDAAVESGIPVVTVDSDVPNSKRLAHVGTDWFHLGAGLADKLATLMGGHGKALMIGIRGIPNTELGFRGFQHRIAAYPDIEVLGPENDLDVGFDKAQAIVAEYLNKHPDLTGIAGFDGNSGPGAALALEEAGVKPTVKLICVDADALHLEHIRTGAMDAAFFHKREAFTYLAFQMLYAYNHGSLATGCCPGPINIPGNIDTGYVVVTKDNIDSFETELSLDDAFERYELSQRLALLSSMVENSAELALATDTNGQIVYANPASVRLCGFTGEQMLASSFGTIFDLTDEQRAQVARCAAEGHLCSFETLARRRNSSTFPVQLSVSPLKTETAIRGTVLVATDITERKRAEETLRQRNRSLALLNQAGRALTTTLDLDQVLATVLEEVCRLMGTVASSIWLDDPATDELVCLQATGPQSEIVRGWRLAPGEGIAGWVAHHGKSLIVPDTRADERHFEGVDQQIETALRSILSVPLRVRQGVIGVLQVVDTEVDRFSTADLEFLEPLAAAAASAIENARLHRELRDHAEQLEQRVQERTAQLQAQYARVEAILHSTSDGIVVTDIQGEILQTNPVAQVWLSQTLSPEDTSRLREAVQNLARQATVETTGSRAVPAGAVLAPARAAGGERPETVLELTGLDLELTAAPVSPPRKREEREGEEAVAVVNIHDVSHLKALDRMKTRFVTNVSHELRTPVTTIKLYAYLMQQQPERWEEYLDALAQEADHQAQLVEDILQISRMDAGRAEMYPRPTSLNELARLTVVSHQALAQDQGLTLEHRPMSTSGAETELVTLMDPERIMQVLNNLVQNAIRYTPEGGKVVVSTGREETEGRAWATATVADTGMGIPEEELPHIFERFFRGEKPQIMQISGSGLGLAIAKEIVELHGGWMTVESHVGEGTAFTITLPIFME